MKPNAETRLKAAAAAFIARPGDPTPEELEALGAEFDRYIDAELARRRYLWKPPARAQQNAKG